MAKIADDKNEKGVASESRAGLREDCFRTHMPERGEKQLL